MPITNQLIYEPQAEALIEMINNFDNYPGINITPGITIVTKPILRIEFTGLTKPHHVYKNNLLQFIEIDFDLNTVRYGYFDQDHHLDLNVDKYFIPNKYLNRINFQ
jgi:hypothetical protein